MEWMPIETAPRDGTPILIAAIDDGFVYDVLNGHFEVLSEDEDDGPWDICGGEAVRLDDVLGGTYFGVDDGRRFASRFVPGLPALN